MASLSHEQRNWMPEYYGVLAALTASMISIRLLSRFLRIGERFGIDDMFITLAWLISIPAGVLSVIGLHSLPLFY
jgi:hypothetical protein